MTAFIEEGRSELSKKKAVSSVRWYKSVVKWLAVLTLLSLFFFFFTSFLPFKQRKGEEQKGKKEKKCNKTRRPILNQESKEWLRQRSAYKSMQLVFRVAYEPLGPLCFVCVHRYFLIGHSRLKWMFLAPFPGMSITLSASWVCGLACIHPEPLSEIPFYNLELP